MHAIISLPVLLDRELIRQGGISNFEYSVMARLSQAEHRQMRIGELAEHTGSTMPRLSKALTRCEREGWVARRPDASNGRCTLAVLSDEGLAKVVECAAPHVAQVRRLIFDPLTPARARQFDAALSAISTAIKREFERDTAGVVD